jgi:sigma-B regulation protein RsbU (phosphoserine phosphatase)
VKVLVVDDDLVTSMLVAEDLKKLGYQVQHGETGDEGWEAYQRGTFPIVIVDWEMPGLSGPELCKLIRQAPDRGYTYIILLTGRSKREDRFNALAAGADDFLTKPVDSAELHARLAVASRILENEDALQRLNVQIQAARQHEGELASAIQKELLLGTPPPDREHLRIASMCVPSSMVAGDFYDFYRHAGNITDIVTGDVMGKGVPAALVAAGVKSSLEKGLLSSLGTLAKLPSLDALLNQLCGDVVPRLTELSTFSTLTYARFDEAACEMAYVNCGNPEILHWKALTGESELLPTTTAPIGFFLEDDFTPSRVQLSPGDLLLFYSDGITDLLVEGERMSSQKFLAWATARAHLPLPALLEELHGLRESGQADDDFTCVAVRCMGSSQDDHFHAWTECDSLASLREIAKRQANLIPLGEDAIDELVLALHEAATNAVVHARPGQEGIPLQVAFDVQAAQLAVTLSYPGVEFDPTAFAPIDSFAEDNVGGFGLTIMQRCTDRMEYRYEGGRNHLTLFKAP